MEAVVSDVLRLEAADGGLHGVLRTVSCETLGLASKLEDCQCRKLTLEVS